MDARKEDRELKREHTEKLPSDNQLGVMNEKSPPHLRADEWDTAEQSAGCVRARSIVG